MAYPIENKLVIAVASSALFDLSECDAVFREKGEEEYRKFQKENHKVILKKGIAFPFIKRFLCLNKVYSDEVHPVEVVLLSKNDPDTGLRVFESIKHYKLDIVRAGFLTGKSPYQYIPAFNASLFLSADASDVKQAIDAGYAAGTVLKTQIKDDPDDLELRIAFDFDGVIVDDQAEKIYQETKDLDLFLSSEEEKAIEAHDPGPLKDFFFKLSRFQKLEHERSKLDPTYKRVLRTAIVTARNAPAHERVVTTLNKWGVTVDEAFFLGGIDKSRILNVLKPHIYFDDQMTHLESAAKNIPSVHIPFGVVNKK
ncbi:5'-nucleotidase [Treponema denticola]|uniref:5'-nucleotidase n=1 Tax=Treponema denticola H-22 TaxID=999432 RepID=A0A0E2E711_TREDN|nr:5'-nucleotidase [Treponema denticola]EMB35414.1 hypothetical protein HMPREF9726_00555 [Treponema denticola H-22]